MLEGITSKPVECGGICDIFYRYKELRLIAFASGISFEAGITVL